MRTRALLTWLVFIPVAFINGALRSVVLTPFTSELRAHQISAFTGSGLFLAVTYKLFGRFAREERDRALLLVGVAWVVATELFEFGFFHYVTGTSWSALLRAYDVTKGELWVLVLLTLLVAPLAVKRLPVQGPMSRNRPYPETAHAS